MKVSKDASLHDGAETFVQYVDCEPPDVPAPASRPCKLACAVSGKPARYRDPLTGLPFHDVAAFAELRARSGGCAADSPNGAIMVLRRLTEALDSKYN
eukprot:1448625-Amphidinium_carterae.1